MGIIETQVQESIDITSQCPWGTNSIISSATKEKKITYYPQTRTVSGWFVVYTESNITSNTNLMTIGEEYRPKNQTPVPMVLVYGDSYTTMVYKGEIYTNGNIYETLGSYAHRILCTFEYQI